MIAEVPAKLARVRQLGHDEADFFDVQIIPNMIV